ncbi:MAG: ABC transporter ATP-binding protein/permease [Lachnospiraceae bacterium]|nr:ABC transporter ATP-binding protein/permease [Lachnospiraceae bacterium]
MNKNTLTTIKRILSLTGNKGKLKISVMIIFVIIQAVIIAFSPLIMGNAITILAEGVMGNQGIDFDALMRTIYLLLGIYVVNYLVKLIQEYMMSDYTSNIVYSMRVKIADKLKKLPVGYYEKRSVGDILSTVTNDIDVIATGLQSVITTSIYSIVLIVIILVVMLNINLIMAGIVLITLPISIFSMKGIVKKAGAVFYEQQLLVGELNGQIEENLSGFQVIKAYSREKAVLKSFEEENDKLCDKYEKSQFMTSMIEPITMFIGNIGYIAVICVGALLAIKGMLTIGNIQAFINYVNNFNQPVQNAAKMSGQIQMIFAASKRVFEFLDEAEEEDIDIKDIEVETVQAMPEGAVEFKNISFGYNKEHTIIHDFSLDVPKGKQVAIVGPTGAGKSTIIKLLMRFYDVDQGSITVDGMNLKEMSRKSLHSGIGMVLQETWLFRGTIMENIRFGRLDATDEEVLKAAQMAEADYFINTLPGGYEFELSEDGQNISAGQRQLLTIARTILANRPILILDEATSSVDTQTEHRIQKAMDLLMEGKTSFIIAHRLSTIRNADVILVLKDGDIFEQGTHEELLNKQGFYYELYNAQFT